MSCQKNIFDNLANKVPVKPTKSLKNREFEERRIKSLCFYAIRSLYLGSKGKIKGFIHFV
jgi:hypothetical protein